MRKSTVRRFVGVSAALAAALVVLPANPASADGVMTITSAAHTNLCLDVSQASTDNGAPVIQWPCNGGANQEWYTYPDAYGRTTIRNVHSGKCLDDPGGSETWGVGLVQWDCNDGMNQSWWGQGTASTGYELFNQAANQTQTMVMDEPGWTGNWGTQIDLWGKNDGANQHWFYNYL